MTAWIRCVDRLPARDEQVLVWTGGDEEPYRALAYWMHEGQVWLFGSAEDGLPDTTPADYVTHWQPLPPPPSALDALADADRALGLGY